MKGAKHPLLLSQSLQAKWGFTKDARPGRICLQDYDDEQLEVVRQAGTGLWMVRIDHLMTRPFAEDNVNLGLSHLLINEEDEVDYFLLFLSTNVERNRKVLKATNIPHKQH